VYLFCYKVLEFESWNTEFYEQIPIPPLQSAEVYISQVFTGLLTEHLALMTVKHNSVANLRHSSDLNEFDSFLGRLSENRMNDFC
jgi:hypothetical protein